MQLQSHVNQADWLRDIKEMVKSISIGEWGSSCRGCDACMSVHNSLILHNFHAEVPRGVRFATKALLDYFTDPVGKEPPCLDRKGHGGHRIWQDALIAGRTPTRRVLPPKGTPSFFEQSKVCPTYDPALPKGKLLPLSVLIYFHSNIYTFPPPQLKETANRECWAIRFRLTTRQLHCRR